MVVPLSSGYNEQQAIELFAGKGLSGFIQKPYQLATLEQKLRELLERPGRGYHGASTRPICPPARVSLTCASSSLEENGFLRNGTFSCDAISLL